MLTELDHATVDHAMQPEDNPALQAKAQEAATRLGLNYVYHFVGYGDLAEAIRGIVDV